MEFQVFLSIELNTSICSVFNMHFHSMTFPVNISCALTKFGYFCKESTSLALPTKRRFLIKSATKNGTKSRKKCAFAITTVLPHWNGSNKLGNKFYLTHQQPVISKFRFVFCLKSDLKYDIWFIFHKSNESVYAQRYLYFNPSQILPPAFENPLKWMRINVIDNKFKCSKTNPIKCIRRFIILPIWTISLHARSESISLLTLNEYKIKLNLHFVIHTLYHVQRVVFKWFSCLEERITIN